MRARRLSPNASLYGSRGGNLPPHRVSLPFQLRSRMLYKELLLRLYFGLPALPPPPFLPFLRNPESTAFDSAGGYRGFIPPRLLISAPYLQSKPDRAIMQNELGTPAEEDRRNLPQRLPLPSPINNLVAAKPLDLTPLDGTKARWAILTSNPRVAELFAKIVTYVLNPNSLHGPPGHTFDDAVKYLVSLFFEQEDFA